MDPIWFLNENREEETKTVLEDVVAEQEKNFKMIFKSSADFETQSQAIIQHCLPTSPEKIKTKDYSGAESEVEVEAEAELEQEQEAAVEQQKENELEQKKLNANAVNTPRNIQPLNILLEDLFATELQNEKIFTISKELNPNVIKSCELDAKILLSKNLLASEEGSTYLLNPAIKPCGFILCVEKKGTQERRMVLLSSEDDVSELLKANNPNYTLCLRYMTGAPATELEADFDEDWKQRFAQIQFLSGILNGYIQEEDSWLWAKNTAEKLKFYRQFVLPLHPETALTFGMLDRVQKLKEKKSEELEQGMDCANLIPPWKVKKQLEKGLRANHPRMKYIFYIPIIGFLLSIVPIVQLALKMRKLNQKIREKHLDSAEKSESSKHNQSWPKRLFFAFSLLAYDTLLQRYRALKSLYDFDTVNLLPGSKKIGRKPRTKTKPAAYINQAGNVPVDLDLSSSPSISIKPKQTPRN